MPAPAPALSQKPCRSLEGETSTSPRRRWARAAVNGTASRIAVAAVRILVVLRMRTLTDGVVLSVSHQGRTAATRARDGPRCWRRHYLVLWTPLIPRRGGVLPTSKVSSGNDTSGHSWRRNVLFGLTVVVGVSCVCLGIWQLRRLAGRRSANNAILAGRAQPLLVIADESGPGPIANRRARVTGELDEQREFVIRDRVVQGVPAVVIVTPLRIPGRDTALLVTRGYVPAPDAVDPHSRRWAEPGPVRFQGDLLPVPDLGDGQPLTHDGRETWKRLDLSAMRRRPPHPLQI